MIKYNIKLGQAQYYKRYYTPQVDERDCGVAALNMLLQFNGSDYSLAHLRQLAKTDQEGTTALGLSALLRRFILKPRLSRRI